MNFNIGGKKNMGILMTLALVIVLTHSRMFDYLTESLLGRMLLLSCIIFIAYASKFLGLLAVLFIIIAYNHYGMNVFHNFSFMEGFKEAADKVSSNLSLLSKDSKNKRKLADAKRKKMEDSDITTTSSSMATSNVTGIEGFCMSDRELMMLRGKRSNTIPVFNNARDQDDYVGPSDAEVFDGEFATV